MKISMTLIFSLSFCFLNLFHPINIVAQDNLPDLIKNIQPSILMINTFDDNDNPVLQGTGFFINEKGDVISNMHVFEGATKATVKKMDGKTYSVVEILAKDIDGDLIMVSVNTPQKEVQPLKINNSSPEVGAKIIVIGSPLGFEQTVSDGIISAVRNIPGFGDILQMTAPISPGSSGSPVVTMNGNVVGVATMLVSGGQNLNFAVPCGRVLSLTSKNQKDVKELRKSNIEDSLAYAQLLYKKGLAFYWAHNTQAALSCLEQAIRINPNYFDAYLQVGVCYFLLEKHEVAITAYKKAIQIEPNNAYAHEYLGSVYNKMKRFDNAIIEYIKVTQIEPDNELAHQTLGGLYLNLDKYAEASKEYREVIRIDPDSNSVYGALGYVYKCLKRFKDAIESYKQSIRINPDDEMLHMELGEIYRVSKKYKDAIESYKQAIRLDPNYSSAIIAMGMVFKDLKSYSDAIDAFKQAIRINPKDADAHFNIADTYIRLGDKGAALDEYKILKELDKDLSNKLYNILYK